MYYLICTNSIIETSVIDFALVILFFVNKTRYIKRGGTRVTQEELRNLYKERLEREKQTYISKMVKIDPSILSKFKTGKIDLYPNLFERLEDYLLNS